MATYPYVRYDPGANQLAAGPNLAGGEAFPFLRASAATSGAETVTALTKGLPDGGALWFSATVLAVTPGGDAASLAQSGRATHVDSTLSVYVDTSFAAVPAALDGIAIAAVPAGAAVAFQLSGVAGAEVSWRVTVSYEAVPE